MTDSVTKPKPAERLGVEKLTPEEKVERDVARYEVLAQEHGIDLSEEAFNDALKRIGKRVPQSSE